MSKSLIAMGIQIIEVGVTGPEDANRMLITTGILKPNLVFIENTGNTVGTTKETFTTLLNPPFRGGQFRRAIATASVRSTHSTYGPTLSFAGWAIREIEADYDDETNRVELRVTIQVQARGASINVEDVSFQVTTLARVE